MMFRSRSRTLFSPSAFFSQSRLLLSFSSTTVFKSQQQHQEEEGNSNNNDKNELFHHLVADQQQQMNISNNNNNINPSNNFFNTKATIKNYSPQSPTTMSKIHDNVEKDKDKKSSSELVASSSSTASTQYFGSGYKIPTPVVQVMKLMGLLDKYQSSSSNNDNNNNNNGNVWFTQSQIDMMRIKIKQGEKPVVVECPPGSTMVPRLTLYNSAQTESHADFFPRYLRATKSEKSMMNRNNNNNYHYRSNNKNNTTTNTEENKSEGDSNKNETATSNNNNVMTSDFDLLESAATIPQFYGGNLSSTKEKVVSRHLWATLSSVAAQNQFSSNVWYTRSGMKNVSLQPVDSSSTSFSSGGTKTSLPVVVRVHNNPSSRIPQYSQLWNASQLQSSLLSDDSDLTLKFPFSSSSENENDEKLPNMDEVEHEYYEKYCSASEDLPASGSLSSSGSSSGSLSLSQVLEPVTSFAGKEISESEKDKFFIDPEDQTLVNVSDDRDFESLMLAENQDNNEKKENNTNDVETEVEKKSSSFSSEKKEHSFSFENPGALAC